MIEQWKAVPGFEGYYEVSDQGRARSLDRVVTFVDGRIRKFKGQPCKHKTGSHGYPLVLISKGTALKKWCLIHRLVMLAFAGPCPEGMEVCHNNGDRNDPRLANLRYDTRANNSADRRRHGTMIHGAEHPFARYSDAEIEAVRGAKGLGTMDDLAARFGMSRTHIWNIQNDKRRAANG